MATVYKKADGIVVVVDDGHDMDLETGKMTPFIPELGRRIKENEFNRAVTDRLAHHLRRLGFTVTLSAPGDRFTSLEDRVKRAVAAKADVFVSNHYDAFDGKFDKYDPSGFTVFVAPGSPKTDKYLAQKLLAEMAKTPGQVNRGMKSADFYVISAMPSHIPAVLIENGFMDHKKEALLMLDKQFIESRAIQQTRALCTFFSVRYVDEKKPAAKPAAPAKKPAAKPAATPVAKPAPKRKTLYALILAPKLNLHNKKDLTDKTIEGHVNKGDVFTVVEKGTVEGGGKRYPVVKLKSGFWISANSQHVRLYEK